MVVQALGLGGDQVASGAARTTAGTTLTSAGTMLLTASTALETAAATMSGGSSILGGLMGPAEEVGMFAQGGDVPSAAQKAGISVAGLFLHSFTLKKWSFLLDLANGVRNMVRGGGAQGGRGGGGNNYGHTFHITGTGPKDIAQAVKLALRMGHR